MSNNNQQIYDSFLKDIEVLTTSNISLREKYISLKKVLDIICKECTKDESSQFSSLFSRIIFICNKYQLDRYLENRIQQIRTKSTFLLKSDQNTVSKKEFSSAISTISSLLSAIYKCSGGVVPDLHLYEEPTDNQTIKVHFEEKKRIELLKIDKENNILFGESDNPDDGIIKVKYGIKNVNEVYTNSIARFWTGAQLNIINSQIDNDGYYIPSYIVLEPDYLIDASSMAECFQNYGRSHLHYFRRKFEETPNSQYILLGNLANFFLDELIFSENPENLKFEDVFIQAFLQKPFEFTACTDIKAVSDFRTFMSKAKVQFNNIQRVILNDFNPNAIHAEECILEPSFFCEKFGFQGRLDLLQLPNDDNIFKIIELKSGGVPFPKDDAGRISINHEVQTAIYRLILQSVFSIDSRKVMPFILYSAVENAGENLRFAAPYVRLEKEIINLRNLIISTEYQLYKGNLEDVQSLFDEISNLDNYGKTPSFFDNRILDFDKSIRNISELERIYILRLISFVSRELYIYKIGNDDYDSNTSIASLWNTEYVERQKAYDLISNLTISSIDDSGRDMKIFLSRAVNDEFANFRDGDICILYPHSVDSDTVLTNQIFKGTIVEITSDYILLRFRYKQKNKQIFNKYKHWTIEHDRLDHTYNNMFKSLFHFIQADIDKRQLILGVKEPQSLLGKSETDTNENLDQATWQNKILQKAIAAQDYFLIVGPPGTGKTSIFARKLIEHYYDNTSSNILILAYTNRAVDELCEVVDNLFKNNNISDQYIRIGSELSCAPKFKDKLLQNIAAKVKSRDELKHIIFGKRIFIGTLASIIGKPELFSLKKFDIAIIDEASQILEPQIVGLLPKFNKFIMIGDHKQLSTITLQNSLKSSITEPQLNNIQMYNCNESLFERLFRVCKTNSWHLAYDTLIYQGRMHIKLAEFPNKYFYDNKLRTVSDWQTEALNQNGVTPKRNALQDIIFDERISFIDSVCYSNIWENDKINDKEAEIVSQLCHEIYAIYKSNNLHFDIDKTLGVITPYRNQIALIKHKLQDNNIPALNHIMVDTVERFQGSQRDIIIISFCMNRSYQLDFFCNMNSEQSVDRKLNVALTRARQRLILIGNSRILRQNPIYNQLLDYIS